MANLSEAVHHWIEYQRCIGIDRFLNESALTIPIVGYLRSQGWETKKETDYGIVCDTVTAGICYADFYLVRNDERLILETKFFRTSSKNSIFNDFVRLALPSIVPLTRYALLAWSKETLRPWGLFKDVLNMMPGTEINLSPHELSLICNGSPSTLPYNAKEFAKLCDLGAPVSKINASCIQRSEAAGYGVILFSISRS